MGRKKFRKNSYKEQNSSPIKTRALTRRLRQNSQQLAVTNHKNRKLENNANKQAENNLKVKMDRSKYDMLLLHLATYDGRKENNIVFYIKQFENLAKDSDMEESQKVTILKAKFSGPARETLINSPELCNEEDFEQLKTKLIEEFQPKKSVEEIQQEFKNLKQRPEQTIDDFVKVFKLKAAKYIQKVGSAEKKDAQEFFDKIKMQEFLNMIRSDIAVDVRKTAPKSLQEAINQAKQIEAALNSIPKIEAESNNAISQTLLNISSTHMDEINKLKEKIKELELKNLNQKKKEKFCAICKNKSHDTEECFYNAKNKSSQKQQKNNFSDRNQNYGKGRNAPLNFMYPGYHPNMMPVMFPQAGFAHNQNYAAMPQPYNPYMPQGTAQNTDSG